VLDPALLRPGRFDRDIRIDLPDLRGREAILRVHAAKTKLDPSVDLSRIARSTPGFSGAELAALVNEAAIRAASSQQETVLEDDLEEARDKIRWGRSKRSRALDDDERRITAYHEAGHAIVATLTEEVDPLHKVTIIPRGPSLGSTMQLPEKDRHHTTREYLNGTLAVLYAGRVAEEIFCDSATTGAHSDIQRATEIARRMVCEFGMSEGLGPINYSDQEETLFLGREIARHRSHSEHTSKRIDEEIQRLVTAAYERARELLRKHRAAVERVTTALLERETLSGAEVRALVVSG
jgi:cell division protease FtsH